MSNEEVEQPVAPVVDTSTKADTPEQEELKAKEEQKVNLEKAILEANDELRRVRGEIKDAKSEPTVTKPEETELQVDLNDPSARAWDKHFNEKIAPLSSETNKAKLEVRNFALRRFLSDKPALAKNPEKLKELMSTYDRLKVATETTQEGVIMDLEKAYGATFHEELISAARSARIEQAKEDMISSDIAIDRGSTSETSAPPTKRQLTAEERRIVEQWEANGAPTV